MHQLARKLVFILTLTCSWAVLAEEKVSYVLSFDNAVHHEANIAVTFIGAETDTLTVRMSRSSPGRYAIHEFAKNVYNVRAHDHNGKPLLITRVSPYYWEVANDPQGTTVSYTLFADRADGTYSGIDTTHAHLNMPATLMWTDALAEAPVEIQFNPLTERWQVASQLVKTDDPYRFTAPDLQYLMDSPTELSAQDVISWQQSSHGKPYQINLAVHHPGTPEDVEAFAEQAKKVVTTQMAVFGELPDFDYGEYTFIADYMPQSSSDGMEHRNSTFLVKNVPLHETELIGSGHIRTLSHEFFHSWNVERIRPASLEPFDFTRANATRNLWFAEGFTSYYGELTLKRTGEFDDNWYYDVLTRTINAVSLRNGPKYHSPEIMSMHAPFVDAATTIDPTNFANTFLSYYTYGHGLGIALDLMIRSEFPGKSLDDMMRVAWQTLGKTQTPYTADDLQKALAEAVGDNAFAEAFFNQYVHGSAIPPYKQLLANAGLTLTLESPDTASLGPVNLYFDGKAAIIDSSVIAGTPLYQTGLEKGDQILKLGRYDITDNARWEHALGKFKPGDETVIRFKQMGEEKEAKISFIQKPELVVESLDEDELTSQQLAFRAAWLGDVHASGN